MEQITQRNRPKSQYELNAEYHASIGHPEWNKPMIYVWNYHRTIAKPYYTKKEEEG